MDFLVISSFIGVAKVNWCKSSVYMVILRFSYDVLELITYPT